MNKTPWRRMACSFGALALVCGAAAHRADAAPQWPADWLPLVKALQQAGYQVRFEKPPIQGAYGATNSRKKIIWVAPISVDLGIGRQTLIHEAVHGAQGCKTGKLETIGWPTSMVNAVDREVAGILYRNYAHAKFDVSVRHSRCRETPRHFR